jgi:hypothetical protein
LACKIDRRSRNAESQLSTNFPYEKLVIFHCESSLFPPLFRKFLIRIVSRLLIHSMNSSCLIGSFARNGSSPGISASVRGIVGIVSSTPSSPFRACQRALQAWTVSTIVSYTVRCLTLPRHSL